MDLKDVKQIVRSYTFLRERLLGDDDEFMERLKQQGVLTEAEFMDITHERSRQPTDKMLTVILSKSQEQYKQFLHCLELTGWEHVLRMLSQPRM